MGVLVDKEISIDRQNADKYTDTEKKKMDRKREIKEEVFRKSIEKNMNVIATFLSIFFRIFKILETDASRHFLSHFKQISCVIICFYRP